MRKIYEFTKVDVAIPAASLNGNLTSLWFPMAKYRGAIAILQVGAIAATFTAKIELLQATSNAGAGSKGIPTTVGQLATATITANTLGTSVKITLATFLAAGTITVNGLVFTAHATVTTVASRQFSISGTDTADALEFLTCVNDATYGVPGVFASQVAGVVTLVAKPAGEKAITISSAPDDATSVKAVVQAQAFVEVNTSKFDLAGGFNHIAVKVTTDSAQIVSAVLLRGPARITQSQVVGASATV